MNLFKTEKVQDQLQAWVDNLPLANPLRSAELIYNKLAEIPLAQYSSANCFALLTTLKTPIDSLYEGLEQQLTGKSFLSQIEYSQQTALLLSLLRRYASAYAVLLNLASPTELLPNGDNLLAACIHQALSALARVLLISYQLHLAPPPQLWLKLHTLYLQAEKAALTQSTLTHTANETATIADIYKLCILLSTANPYQLRALDLLHLYERLSNWSRHTDLSINPVLASSLCLQLNEDRPPFYPEGRDKNANPLYFRGLDTQALLTQLNTAIKQHEDQNQSAGLSQTILKNIAKAWQDSSDRSMQRQPHQGKIELSLGLASTFIHSGGAAFSQENSESEAHQKSLLTNYPILSWDIVNISPNGYCLQADKELMINVQSGDLLGLHQISQTATSWRAGTVRWVKKIETGHIQIGVMLLGASIIAVKAELANQTKPESYRALIIPEIFNIAKPSSIIIPAYDFLIKEHLIIHFSNHKARIQLTNPLNLNDKYYQYHYEIIAELNESNTDTNNDDGELENVWDRLK